MQVIFIFILLVRTDDKCGEKPQMFGRADGDYMMMIPPIKWKTILEPKLFCLISLITIGVLWSIFFLNHCFSI